MDKKQSIRQTATKEDLERAAFLLEDRYTELISPLTNLPDLLQLVIENYKLDSRDYTERDMMKLGGGHAKIYSVLYTVQQALFEFLEKTEVIDSKAIIAESFGSPEEQ